MPFTKKSWGCTGADKNIKQKLSQKIDYSNLDDKWIEQTNKIFADYGIEAHFENLKNFKGNFFQVVKMVEDFIEELQNNEILKGCHILRILDSGNYYIYTFKIDFPEQKNELIRFANMALHHSKKNGKNIFTTFDFDMQRVLIQHLTLQTKLTSAILDSNFVMYYQPQFDIKTKELRGFEALIRWEDSELGNIPPSVFIPLAEETGLIIPIGTWVLNTAFSTLKKWQIKYNFKGIMSVNISPKQLKQHNFIDELQNLLVRYNLSPSSIELEITEGIMINNMRATIDKLQVLRSMGLKVSLDDFGTGYSSLSYLQKLPLNTLKIDKSFISNITSNDGVQANITSSIIKMVDNMGLETIAEGVENEDQLHLLKDFNCNIVQGFHSGKPMPLELCNEFLAGDMSALITI